MTARGWFLCLFGSGLLAACGGGGAGTGDPPPVSEQRPTASEQQPTGNTQEPAVGQQRPTESTERPPGNSQDPVSPSASSAPVQTAPPKPQAGDNNGVAGAGGAPVRQ